MPDFSPVITLAYMRILGRPPDASGLESYNRAMNSGLTEAQMRESLLRSEEYASKNPDMEPPPTATATRRKKTAKKKAAAKKRSRKR